MSSFSNGDNLGLKNFDSGTLDLIKSVTMECHQVREPKRVDYTTGQVIYKLNGFPFMSSTLRSRLFICKVLECLGENGWGLWTPLKVSWSFKDVFVMRRNSLFASIQVGCVALCRRNEVSVVNFPEEDKSSIVSCITSHYGPGVAKVCNIT